MASPWEDYYPGRSPPPCALEPRSGPVQGPAVRRAGGERGPGTPRLRGRKRGAAPNRQGGAGADADSAGARGLQPWRSSALHLSTSCLAIYSHLLSENSFTHVSGPDKRKGGPPPPRPHTRSETEGRQHSGQAPGASLPESGLPRPRVAPPRQTGAPQGRRRPQRRQQPSRASTGVAGRRGPQKGPDHPTAPPCSGKTNSCTFK